MNLVGSVSINNKRRTVNQRKTMNKILAATAVTLLLQIGTAGAIDLPPMKEGLWSVQMHTVNNPGNKGTDGAYTLCRNHAFDDSVRASAKKIKDCTTLSESFEGGKYASEMRCSVAGTVIQSKGTSIRTGDNAIRSETKSTYTPAMAGITETTMVMDQKYVGACPAGTQPGDRTSPNGTVTHLGKH
jgi:hypothetical protein